MEIRKQQTEILEQQEKISTFFVRSNFSLTRPAFFEALDPFLLTKKDA